MTFTNIIKKNKNLFKISYAIYQRLNYFDINRLGYRKYGNIKIKEYNLLYYPIPKVASSFFKNFFYEQICNNKCCNNERCGNECCGNECCRKKIENSNHEIYFPYEKNKKNLKKYFKFAFVRNPYSRIVSAYFNKILTQKKEIDIFLNDKTLTKKLMNNYTALQTIHYGNIKSFGELSFERFMEIVNKIPIKILDGHLKPQYLFICDKKQNIIVDKIVKLEELNNEIKKVFPEKLYLKYLEHLSKKEKDKKKNKTKHNHYSLYFKKQKIKDLFYNVYENDLILLNYE